MTQVRRLDTRLRKLAKTEGQAVSDALARAPEGAGGRLNRRKFADMGYLPDRKKRFPLNSRTEAAAAWRHMFQPANAILYSPGQLKRIFRRIVDAFHEFGVPRELANWKTMTELEAAIEARRLELEEYRKSAAASLSADKQIRLRTGLDDHLELGEHKPPKRRHVPPGLVTSRYLPPTR